MFKKGYKQTTEWRKKIGISHLAEKNPMWKGDKVKLPALHAWVRIRFPKPPVCQDCKKVPPRDLANISQKYKRDLNDWEWLCRYCHMLKDGRLKQLKTFGYKLTKQNVIWIRKNNKKFKIKEIAKKFNVSYMCAYDVITYRRWPNIK